MGRSYSRLLDLGGQTGGAAIGSARPSRHLTLAHKTKSNSYRSLLSFSPPAMRYSSIPHTTKKGSRWITSRARNK
jgi:hypothetical protein